MKPRPPHRPKDPQTYRRTKSPRDSLAIQQSCCDPCTPPRTAQSPMDVSRAALGPRFLEFPGLESGNRRSVSLADTLIVR